MTIRPNLTILPGQTPLTDAELAAIEARAEAATPGPWTSAYHHGSPYKRQELRMLFGGHGGALVRGARDYAVLTAPDAHFVAAARTDIPRLVAEVRRLRRQVEAMEEAT